MQTFDFEMPEMFSLESITPVQGYDADNDDREYFESAFTFPTAYKKQIVSYLRKHKQEITESIIKGACE
jgi:hypothetical protein